MNSCILICTTLSLISAAIGFVLGKRKGNNHEECNDRITRLEHSLEQSKQAKFEVDKEVKTLKQLI